MSKKQNEVFDEVYGARDVGAVLPRSGFPEDGMQGLEGMEHFRIEEPGSSCTGAFGLGRRQQSSRSFTSVSSDRSGMW